MRINMKPKSKQKLMAMKRAAMTEDEKMKQRQAAKERMAARRKMMSDQEKDKEKEKSRLGMKKKRHEMTEEQKQIQRRSDQERKAEKRKPFSDDPNPLTYGKLEKEFNRLYKIRIREGRSEAAHEYEIINNLLCMRKLRSSRNGKEHLLDNLQAKRGMRLIAEFGYKKPFHLKKFRDISEIELWKWFAKRGSSFYEILKEKKPNTAIIVTSILDQEKKEKEEKEANEKAKRDKGFWEFDYNMDRWMWTGLEPPGPYDPDPNDDCEEPQLCPWDDEAERLYNEAKDLEFKWYQETQAKWAKEDRERRNKIARDKYHAKKEELLKPIIVPEFELCEYEKIRERNIKEREDALKAAGFCINKF